MLVLMLAAITGAGIGSYYLHAQLPAPKEGDKENKEPEVTRGMKPAQDATARLKARAAVAEKVYHGKVEELTHARRFGNTLISGTRNSEDVCTWSVRLLQAQRDLSPKHENQVAALEAHLKRMTELKEVIKQLSRDLMPVIHVSEVEWYRLEAEIWLAEAKSAKEK